LEEEWVTRSAWEEIDRKFGRVWIGMGAQKFLMREEKRGWGWSWSWAEGQMEREITGLGGLPTLGGPEMIEVLGT